MPVSQISIVVPGRNDDYGGNFKERLYRSLDHNLKLLAEASIEAEVIFVEWNPVPQKELLARELMARYPNSKAYVVSNSLHSKYSLNPHMVFHEMPAKNVGIRRAKAPWILSANADILMDPQLVAALATIELDKEKVYRAHRIDVDRNSSFEEMTDPRNQLTSSEGKLPPVDFLGAAGDFILCHSSLWHKLRGMNETARFTTRCKDWQFLLHAKKLGHGIQFLGKVYHLNHEYGFLNTPEETKNSNTCFFGNNWDIELGLPYQNPENWGFYDNERTEQRNGQPVNIDDSTFSSTEALDEQNKRTFAALSGSSESPTEQIAQIFHTFLYAKTSNKTLHGRFHSDFLAVAFAGLMSASESQGKPVSLQHAWPESPYLPKSESKSIVSDLTLVESIDGSLKLFDGNDSVLEIPTPSKRPINSPLFDPLLLRRLLNLYLVLHQKNETRLSLYGAGSHSKEIANWGIPDFVELDCFYSTEGSPERLLGLQVLPISQAAKNTKTPILISSKSFETEMLETLSKVSPEGTCYTLYATN